MRVMFALPHNAVGVRYYITSQLGTSDCAVSLSKSSLVVGFGRSAILPVPCKGLSTLYVLWSGQLTVEILVPNAVATNALSQLVLFGVQNRAAS